MKQLEIGEATLEYTRFGEVTNAVFTPSMKIEYDKSINDQLRQIESKRDVESMRENAALVMASWFSKMNEIELSDKFQYGIDSEIVECERYDDDMPKKCVIKFVFKKLNLN